MKQLITTILLIGILLIQVFLLFGQEKQKPMLVDEFGRANCEELLARMDNFMIQLAKNPDSYGLAIIQRPVDSYKMAVWYEKMMLGYLYERKFDTNRFRLCRGDSNPDEIAVQFWLVPSDAKLPDFVEGKWGDPREDLSKPFIYDSLYGTDPDYEQMCPTFVPKLYAEIIRNNPDVRSHIVVINDSYSLSKKIGAKWLKVFTKEYGLPRNRIRIFYTKHFRRSKHPRYDDLEFWIVPIRKR